jgi:hypothetical protein
MVPGLGNKIMKKGNIGLGEPNPTDKLNILNGGKVGDGSLVFGATYPGGKGEVIRIEKGKFFWMGKEVKDINKIYERFSKWMTLAEKSK